MRKAVTVIKVLVMLLLLLLWIFACVSFIAAITPVRATSLDDDGLLNEVDFDGARFLPAFVPTFPTREK